MDVSVTELRNHTARVVSAIERGELVVLTIRGRPVADIVPRRRPSDRRTTETLVSDLAAISQVAGELGVTSDADDFDVGLTTDDMTSSWVSGIGMQLALKDALADLALLENLRVLRAQTISPA